MNNDDDDDDDDDTQLAPCPLRQLPPVTHPLALGD